MQKFRQVFIIISLVLIYKEVNTVNYQYISSDLCGPRCITCNQYTSICETCAQGFYVHNVFKFCIKSSDSNCSTFSSRDYCETCADGYFNDLGSCVACTASNCKKCDYFPSECTSCIDNYYGTTDCSVACIDSNCATCSSASSANCTACKDGYFLESGACGICKKENCKTCSISAGVCESCADGYYFSAQNTCTSCEKGCLTCDSNSGICTACDTTQTTKYYQSTDLKCHHEPEETAMTAA